MPLNENMFSGSYWFDYLFSAWISEIIGQYGRRMTVRKTFLLLCLCNFCQVFIYSGCKSLLFCLGLIFKVANCVTLWLYIRDILMVNCFLWDLGEDMLLVWSCCCWPYFALQRKELIISSDLGKCRCCSLTSVFVALSCPTLIIIGSWKPLLDLFYVSFFFPTPYSHSMVWHGFFFCQFYFSVVAC